MLTYYDIAQPIANNEQEMVEALYITYDGESSIAALPKFINLKVLELNLKHPLPEDAVLGQFSKLEQLVLRNKIGDLQAVCYLLNLCRLSIEDVSTPNFKIPSSIQNLENLVQLNIKNTTITTLPPQIGQLKGLLQLNLVSNKYLATLPEELYDLSLLETLIVSGCPIAHLSEKLGALTKLKTFNISHTEVATLPTSMALHHIADFYFWECPVYDQLGNYHSFMTTLLEKVTDSEKRKTFFNLFFGYNDRIKAQNLGVYVQEAMNYPDAMVRAAAMSYWYRYFESPFPPTEKMVLHLAPAKDFLLDWEYLTPLLEERGIKISPKINAQVTHLIVGDKPNTALNKAIALRIPVVSKGHFNAYLRIFDDSVYLDKKDEDTLEMAENLRNLLRSEDTANVALGLQMALGGGINDVYLYDILLLYLWNFKSEDSHKLAVQVLEKFLPMDTFQHLKNYHRERGYTIHEDSHNVYLSNIAKHNYFDANKLAIYFYEKFQAGHLFCLSNPESFLWFCNKKRKNSVLSLQALNLKKILDCVGKLKGVKIMYLQKNQLFALPDTFADLMQLDTLNLDNNLLQNFPAILTTMPGLVSLSLANNNLACLPAEIGNMKGLQTLNLYNNKITALPDAVFDLPALRRIDIGGSNPIAREKKAIEEKMPYCQVIAGK